MKALSIRQPWAWLIVNGFKDIENRTWRTNYRGPVLIHAGQVIDREMERLLRHWAIGIHTNPAGFLSPKERPDLIEMASRYCEDMELSVGGIVGQAEIVDCVSESHSPWFQGRFGFVLADAKPLQFVPMRGRLGFFDVAMTLPGGAA